MSVGSSNASSSSTVTPSVSPAVDPLPSLAKEPVVTPSQPSVSPSVITPTVQPSVKPVVDVTSASPTVNPQSTPSQVEFPSIPSTPTAASVSNSTATEEKRTIYGGASPTVSNLNINTNTHHTIYGGADPLENTQSLPRVHRDPSVEPLPTIDPTFPSVETPTLNPSPSTVTPPTSQADQEIESLF